MSSALADGQERSAGTLLALDDAVALARQSNRNLAMAAREIERAESDVAAARTRRFPAFDVRAFGFGLLNDVPLEFKKGSLGTSPTTGPTPFQDTEILTPRGPGAIVLFSAVQPLSQLHRIGLGIHAMELARDLAREKQRGLEQSIIADVKRLYSGILQIESAVAALIDAIALSRDVDQLVGARVVADTALPLQQMDVKVRLAQDEYQLVVLRNSGAELREQLNLALGRDPAIEFQVAAVADADVATVDLTTAVSRALEQRTELREAAIKQRQAEYDLEIKKAESRPDVNLMFSDLLLGNIAVLPPHIAAGGISLTWDIFDWGRKRREQEGKHATIEQARTGVADARARVAADVRARFRKLSESRELLRVAQLSQEAGREKLRVQTAKYRQEAAVYNEVLAAQASLSDANRQYQQALLSYWTARVDFEKAIAGT